MRCNKRLLALYVNNVIFCSRRDIRAMKSLKISNTPHSLPFYYNGNRQPRIEVHFFEYATSSEMVKLKKQFKFVFKHNHHRS